MIILRVIRNAFHLQSLMRQSTRFTFERLFVGLAIIRAVAGLLIAMTRYRESPRLAFMECLCTAESKRAERMLGGN